MEIKLKIIYLILKEFRLMKSQSQEEVEDDESRVNINSKDIGI